MGCTILAILTLLSLALTFWRWIVSCRFPLHQRTPVPETSSGITTLKPLKGCDAETKNCLRSWFAQDYPGPRQLLFGVAEANDPAAAIVRELLAEFPGADARLVVCGQHLGANRKVSTLRQLEPLVRHPVIVISDADTRAPADFLANAASLVTRPNIGLVNCFYRLANPVTLAMHCEAVAVNADFWTNVLQAKSLGDVKFALGAVMTLPLVELQAIGGFAALGDYLADDYQLGNQIARRGRRIIFSNLVVECWDAPANWGQVWAHQTRWARTIRVCQPLPFFFSILNNSTLWPLLLLLGSIKGPPGWVALSAGAVAFRIVTALHQQARLTQARAHFRYWWLTVVKDVADVLIWASAFWGRHVTWRGDRYKILPGGKLEKQIP